MQRDLLHDDTWDGESAAHDDMERCSYCGHIFYSDAALDEDDDEPMGDDCAV